MNKFRITYHLTIGSVTVVLDFYDYNAVKCYIENIMKNETVTILKEGLKIIPTRSIVYVDIQEENEYREMIRNTRPKITGGC